MHGVRQRAEPFSKKLMQQSAVADLLIIIEHYYSVHGQNVRKHFKQMFCKRRQAELVLGC